LVLQSPHKNNSQLAWAFQKNLKPNREKRKKFGYEGIPPMNHFEFMEIDDHVDF
jgi:hypothetical protein